MQISREEFMRGNPAGPDDPIFKEGVTIFTPQHTKPVANTQKSKDDSSPEIDQTRIKPARIIGLASLFHMF